MPTDLDARDRAAAPQGERLEHLSRESDTLLTAIHDIHEMESEKRTVDISTPRFHELADQIVDVSRDVFRHAGEAAAADDDVATTDVTIDQIAGRRSPAHARPH